MEMPVSPSESAVQKAAVLQPSEVRNWSMAAHLSGFAGALIPGGNVVAPLVIWLVKREDSSEIAAQALEALNFQITVTLAMLVALALSLALIGFLLIPVIGIAAIVMMIMATVKASEGQVYRYPLTLRLVR